MDPNEWVCESGPSTAEEIEVENIWTIGNCIWLTAGSLMGQGCDILPR